MLANPPACNTGVHPRCQSIEKVLPSHFDWYRATVPASLELLTQAVLEEAGPYPTITDGSGRFNYLHSRTIESGGDRVATILHGGKNGHPNVEASGGDMAPKLAALLRRGGPHKVTRCDVAVDLFGEGVFEQLKGLAASIADDHRLDCRDIVNRDKRQGDTRYLGSRQSSVFARIYEKGKVGGRVYGDIDPDLLASWVRVELEIKPQKEVGHLAASLEPAEFWGVSAWTQQLAKGALDMNAEPIPFHPRRTASDDRSWATMCNQYRNVVQRRLEAKHGGDRMALAMEWLDTVLPESDEEAA